MDAVKQSRAIRMIDDSPWNFSVDEKGSQSRVRKAPRTAHAPTCKYQACEGGVRTRQHSTFRFTMRTKQEVAARTTNVGYPRATVEMADQNDTSPEFKLGGDSPFALTDHIGSGGLLHAREETSHCLQNETSAPTRLKENEVCTRRTHICIASQQRTALDAVV